MENLTKLNSYWNNLKEGFAAESISFDDADIESDRNADLQTLKRTKRVFPKIEDVTAYLAKVLDVSPQEIRSRKTIDDTVYFINGFMSDIASARSHLGAPPFSVSWKNEPSRIKEVRNRTLSKVEKPIQEEADVSRETEPKNEDVVSVSTVVVSDSAGNSPKKSLYGDKKDFVTYKDDNSKATTPVEREMGSKSAIKDYLVDYKTNISKVLKTVKDTIKI